MTSSFQSHFAFDPKNVGLLGVEREAFVVDQKGKVVPKSPLLLNELRGVSLAACFKPELSACQIESATQPVGMDPLESVLHAQQKTLAMVARRLGYGVSYQPVAPADMPTDHYPDKRYDDIVRQLSPEVLLAACRVAGTHVHVGLPDHTRALQVYNHVVDRFEWLLENVHISSERLRLYQQVAEHWKPRRYQSWGEFESHAIQLGFHENPRDNWALVRLTVHGTIEFRLFDSCGSVSQVMDEAGLCVSLCESVL